MASHVQVGPKSYRLLNEARRLVGARAGFQRKELPGGTPATIGPVAMGLLEQTLGQGCARQLLIRGGWRRDVSLGPKGQVLRGRLWERHDPMPTLEFGPATFEVLRWLTSSGRTKDSGEPLEIGDEVVAYLACETTPGAGSCPIVRHSALAWLGHPEQLGRGGSDVPEVDAFVELVEGAGAFVVEALTDDLASRWAHQERSKSKLTKTQVAREVGLARSRVLEAWLEATDAVGRRDLTTFLVRAALQVVDADGDAAEQANALRPSLSRNQSLRDRQEAIRLSACLFRALGRLSSWYEGWRYVRPFEESYDTAQAMLRSWKSMGRAGFAHAAAVLRELESVDAVVGD